MELPTRENLSAVLKEMTKALVENGAHVYQTHDNNPFQFFYMTSRTCVRPVCYECPFKGFPRCADITIGDYWTHKKNELDDDTGTSIILINSEKGQDYFSEVKKKLKSIPVPFEEILPGNPALLKPLPKSSV